MNARLHFHWDRLIEDIEDINPARAAVQQFLEAQTGRFDSLLPGDPRGATIKRPAHLIQREALVLTYND
jgi:hypothetical protein